MTSYQRPWADKYRPYKLKHIIHQDEIIHTLETIVIAGDIPHLIFHGPPGIGKTTTILALANEIFGDRVCDRVLELNASNERGINTVRKDIITFAHQSTSDKYKLIILDEADAMTQDAQAALRKVMEDTANITRFCIICNYLDRIIAPIISRCVILRFTPIKHDAMFTRLKYIAKCEQLDVSDDVVMELAKLSGGDLRKAMMFLQHCQYITPPITQEAIYDLTGHVPFNTVNELVNLAKSVCSVTQLMIASEHFCKNGYHMINTYTQMNNIIMASELDILRKSAIVSMIAKVVCNLHEGGHEHLQLMMVLLEIHKK
jgi:replication factor C subunit 2/4